MPIPAPPVFLGIAYSYVNHADGSTTTITTVRWKEPTADTTLQVFGVNKCLTSVTGAKCATNGMKIPSSDLLSLVSAPGSQGKASWQFWAPAGVTYYCGALGVVATQGQTAPPDHWYYSVVIRAKNQAGDSGFIVAVTTTNVITTC